MKRSLFPHTPFASSRCIHRDQLLSEIAAPSKIRQCPNHACRYALLPHIKISRSLICPACVKKAALRKTHRMNPADHAQRHTARTSSAERISLVFPAISPAACTVPRFRTGPHLHYKHWPLDCRVSDRGDAAISICELNTVPVSSLRNLIASNCYSRKQNNHENVALAFRVIDRQTLCHLYGSMYPGVA